MSSSINRIQYVYPSGNRLLKIHDGARTTSTYDAANQLVYSHGSNRGPPSRGEEEGPRAVVQRQRTTYTFDADGNQQVVRAPSGDRTTSVWDYENRMTSVQQPSGIRNTMAYDADGLRMKLEESGGTKKFVWDDQNYLAETDAANDTQVVYTNEPRRYGNLISQRRGSTSHWYHFDAIGSTRELTNASAVITDTRMYDAWGRLGATSGTTQSFGYVGLNGYYPESEPDVLYVRLRNYRPSTARWLSVDALTRMVWLRNAMAWPHRPLSAYVYANNTPTTYVDPRGLAPIHSKEKHGGRRQPRGYWQCVAECEAHCADEYYAWEWNPWYVTCVTACHTSCRNESLNPCTYIRMWNQCDYDRIACLCGIIDVADIPQFGTILPVIGEIPEVVLGAADCACQAIDVALHYCNLYPGGHSDPSMWLIDLLTGFTDCYLDVAAFLAGPLDWAAAGPIMGIEASLLAIDQLLLERAFHGYCFPTACAHLDYFGGPCPTKSLLPPMGRPGFVTPISPLLRRR